MNHNALINRGLALHKLLLDKEAPVTRDMTADGVSELIDALEFQTDRNDALQAQIEALTQLRPIESAPKDGTCILAPVGNGFLDVLTFTDGAWRETSNMMQARNQPSHWFPLPDLPTAGTEVAA